MLRYAISSISDVDNYIYEEGLSLMKPERKNALMKIKSEQRKKQSILGEWIAKNLIREETGCSDAVIIERDEKGKPYSPSHPDIFFNISHSEDKVLVAVSDCPVGVDIEKIRPASLRIAKRVCTEKELIYIFGKFPTETDFTSTDYVLHRRFFEIWTAKEAYFKCLGTGITSPKSIDVTTELPGKISFIEDDYVITIIY